MTMNCRVQVRARVIKNGMLLRQQEDANVEDAAAKNRQKADVETPEVVVDRGRIFQPKDENVSGKDDCVQKKQEIRFDDVSQDEKAEAVFLLQGSEEVDCNVGDDHDGKDDDVVPTNHGNDFVGQDTFRVATVSFVPDDSVEEESIERVDDGGNRNKNCFQ